MWVNMLKKIRVTFTYFLIKLCNLLGDGNIAGVLRVWVLRAFGMKKIHPRSKIMYDCVIHDVKDKISIGKYSLIDKKVFFDYSEGIYISKYCSIGYNTIFTYSGKSFKKRKSILKYEPIIVENYVSIGSNCIILSGVTIGAGAIITDGSIVTRDIPPGVLASGRPAKIIKYLYNDNLINRQK